MSGPAALRSRFRAQLAPTFGAEEEVMLLDPATLDLLPRASWALARLGDAPGSAKLTLELPASQVEIVTPTRRRLGELVGDLTEARRRLADGLAGDAALLAAGAHPFAAAEGQLNDGPRYQRLAERYGPVARRQLVCGLHVHVGLGDADRALAVYNAMREHLPELAALAANAPLRGGRDSGMASVRPLIAGMLPRQGVPPVYASWQELEADLAWGRSAGRLEGAQGWWWELRLHPVLGTLEVRVPDAQSLLADTAALCAVTASLALVLAARHDAGELPPPAASWRIAENRFAAARDGLDAQLLDVRSGRCRPARERIEELLDELGGRALEIGATPWLAGARDLLARNGAERQRELLAGEGPRGVAAELSRRFCEPAAQDAGGTAPGRRQDAPRGA